MDVAHSCWLRVKFPNMKSPPKTLTTNLHITETPDALYLSTLDPTSEGDAQTLDP